ncbi:hypothetical protein K439DRAFT_1636403 [Ramaria rubella]|nr:hypothetical protein K439DRAFT_1636403 [Ramaria rubella]
MFGNLASSSSTPSSGFGASPPSTHPIHTSSSSPLPLSIRTGAFGGASTSNNAFGQPKPAFGTTTGGGAFGSTQQQPSAFGTTSGGAFGGAATSGGFGTAGTGGAFGQPAQPPQNAFGGGGLFNKPATPAFGSNALVATNVPATGSSSPPFQEFQERDQSGSVSTTLHYQSISCMPAYRNASFEELRVQDYAQGRKTANSFPSAAAPSAFGQPAQQQQPTTGLFGQPANTGFGQPQQPQQPATGFGAFGQPQQPQQNAFGAFGQPQQPQQMSGFSAFGQPNQNQQQQQPAAGFNAFGQQNQGQQQPATTGFGTFGQQNQQNKPFGTFGQQPNTTSAFSTFGNTSAPATGTTSLFGQPPPQPPQTSPFSAFGPQNNQANQQQSNNPLLKPSVFGQTGGSLFGGNTGGQPQQGGGLFGNPGQQQQPQQGSGLFGTQQSGTNAFGSFGQPAQPQPQQNLFGQPSGGGLFGTNAQQNQNQQQQNQTAPGGFPSLFSKPTTGGLFGNTGTAQNTQQQQQNPNPTNPLFGGGGGLFGNTGTNAQQQQQNPNPANPLFGGGSTGSLFGGKPPAPAPGFGVGGGLFGNSTTQQQQPTPALGGGLFGNTNTQQQQGQQPATLFGGSMFSGGQQQQQQPTLTASIDQPLPASLPSLPSLASSINPKKKSNLFADIAARSSPRLGLGGAALNYTPPGPGSRLRGFGTSLAATSTAAPNPFPASTGKNGLGAGFNEGKSLLSSEAFSSGAGGSLQLLGGARQSVKKLVLDKRVEEDELHRLRGGGAARAASPGKAKEVRFSPALSVAAREKDNEPRKSASPAPSSVPSFARPAPRAASKPNDTPSPAKAAPAASSPSAPLDPQEGEYWCLPTVSDLQRLSFSELQAVKDFTVGRVGFGTIQFLQPVDLTSVPSIADIPGKIVTFEHVECTLYTDERLRPPPGEGLNVPARVKLDRCWALDKSTREPIKNANDPKHQQRMKKMRAQEGAEFVSFDMETGVWEFIVQEF